MTDSALAEVVAGWFLLSPGSVKLMAAEILRLRTDLSRARMETQRTIDLIALAARKAIETVLKCGDLPAPPIDAVEETFGLMAATKAACEDVIRLRRESDVLRSERRRDGEVFAHIRRCLNSIDGDGSLFGLGSRVGAATAELLRPRKESKCDRVANQQALLDEIARLFPGRGPLLERGRAPAKVVEQDKIAERLCRALEVDADEAQLSFGGLSTRPFETW
jgi:hypothetical protein